MFYLIALVLLFCPTLLQAKPSVSKKPVSKKLVEKVLSMREMGRRMYEQQLARDKGWISPLCIGVGSCSSQRLGSQPWGALGICYKISDAGRPGFGPLGWVKTSGFWDVQFTYKYLGPPPATVYRMPYRIVCHAAGTGMIWTKVPSKTYYTAIGKITSLNGHYILRFSTAIVDAEVWQKSNFFAWSGTTDVELIPGVPVPDTHFAPSKQETVP